MGDHQGDCTGQRQIGAVLIRRLVAEVVERPVSVSDATCTLGSAKSEERRANSDRESRDEVIAAGGGTPQTHTPDSAGTTHGSCAIFPPVPPEPAADSRAPAALGNPHRGTGTGSTRR